MRYILNSDSVDKNRLSFLFSSYIKDEDDFEND